jgi:hypothetical protein
VRDAVTLAIDLSGVEAPNELLYAPGDGFDATAPFGATFNPLWVTDTEDDLLAEDLRRFDPDSKLQMPRAGIARFTNDRWALTVMNVNRKPLEKVLGVDLVYWDELANIFTLVQYKRLTRRGTARKDENQRWSFTHREDLAKQLARMNLGPYEPVDSRDYRMTPSPFWFKFVRQEDFSPGDPFVLRGMYVPADYLRLALEDDSLRTGPRDGFELTSSNTRYLPREPFVELVRRGFAGTTRAGASEVVALADQRSQTHAVVLALKTDLRTEQPSLTF